MTTLKTPNLIQQLIHDKAKEHFKIDGDKTVVTMASEDFVKFMTVLTTQSNKHTAQVLCDLLEGKRKPLIHDVNWAEGYNAAIQKAQALIRQTLDPISSNER